MNFGTQRAAVVQTFYSFPLTVPGGAGSGIPISKIFDKTYYITSFIISNPAAGSSVYKGNFGVQATGPAQGLEIQPGTAPNFKIDQGGRQLYELQALSGLIAQQIGCIQPDLEKIPIVVWDLTQIFLISANAISSQVTVEAYPSVYL